MLYQKKQIKGSQKLIQHTRQSDKKICWNTDISELDKICMNLLFKPLQPGPEEQQLDIKDLSEQLAEDGHKNNLVYIP